MIQWRNVMYNITWLIIEWFRNDVRTRMSNSPLVLSIFVTDFCHLVKIFYWVLKWGFSINE